MALVEDNLVGRLICVSTAQRYFRAKELSFANRRSDGFGYLAENGEEKACIRALSTGLRGERKRVW
jgi:hypothetical protein